MRWRAGTVVLLAFVFAGFTACGSSKEEPTPDAGQAGSAPANGGHNSSSGGVTSAPNTAGRSAFAGAANALGGSSGSTSAASGGSAAAGTSGSSGSNALGSAPLRDACRLYVRAYCDRSATCGGYATAAQCYELSVDDCPDLLVSPGSTRTVASLTECAAEIEAFPCADWARGFLPACSTPGTRAGGEPCVYPAQCQSLSCNRPHDSSCDGLCQQLLAPGAVCNDINDVCPAGQRCTDGVCTDYFPPAEPTPRPVTPTLAEGEICSAQTCGKGLFCAGLDTASNGTCTRLPATGLACASVVGATRCRDTDYCSETEICTPLPAAGEPCASDIGSLQCKLGTYCATAGPNANTCQPRGALGEPCDSNFFSLGRSNCDESLVCRCADARCGAGVCANLRREGDPCADTDACEAGTVCEAGRCRASDALSDQAFCDAF
jgi:hypothetical protein